jgi:hypothetical protein
MHQPVTRPVMGRRRRQGNGEETSEHRTTEGVNSNDEG